VDYTKNSELIRSFNYRYNNRIPMLSEIILKDREDAARLPGKIGTYLDFIATGGILKGYKD
jgi:hypothetical protein